MCQHMGIWLNLNLILIHLVLAPLLQFLTQQQNPLSTPTFDQLLLAGFSASNQLHKCKQARLSLLILRTEKVPSSYWTKRYDLKTWE
jgi:hypothetical protein